MVALSLPDPEAGRRHVTVIEPRVTLDKDVSGDGDDGQALRPPRPSILDLPGGSAAFVVGEGGAAPGLVGAQLAVGTGAGVRGEHPVELLRGQVGAVDADALRQAEWSDYVIGVEKDHVGAAR